MDIVVAEHSGARMKLAADGIYRANLDGSNVEALITGMEEAAVIVLGP